MQEGTIKGQSVFTYLVMRQLQMWQASISKEENQTTHIWQILLRGMKKKQQNVTSIAIFKLTNL